MQLPAACRCRSRCQMRCCGEGIRGANIHSFVQSAFSYSTPPLRVGPLKVAIAASPSRQVKGSSAAKSSAWWHSAELDKFGLRQRRRTYTASEAGRHYRS
jgi:hypothetical protein